MKMIKIIIVIIICFSLSGCFYAHIGENYAWTLGEGTYKNDRGEVKCDYDFSLINLRLGN